MPGRYLTESKGNNGNKIINTVAWDYDTINVGFGVNTEIDNVIIDSSAHTACYRYSSGYSETGRILLDKMIITQIRMNADGGYRLDYVLQPNFSVLGRCHVVDTISTTDTSSYIKGHMYIQKVASIDTQYHEVYGWANGIFKHLGYYVDTFGLIK